MRKRPIRVEVRAKYATRGSMAARVGPSGNREAPRRISETSPCRPRGLFAPFTWVLIDLSGLFENAPYLAWAKYATTGSAADRVGSPRNRKIPRRISQTATGPPRGGFSPFTRISLDLSEFGENGAYVDRGIEICGHRIRGRLRWIVVNS